MAYTSKAQIIDRWGTDEVVRSADRDPEDGVVDDAAVTAACADASSLIDSYLERGGHKTPVDPVPDVLVKYASDIAVYNLSQGTAPYTEEKRKRYEDAIAWLESVAKNVGADLPNAPDESKTARSARAGGFPLKYSAGQLRGGGLL